MHSEAKKKNVTTCILALMERSPPRGADRIAHAHMSYRTRHRTRSHDSAHTDDAPEPRDLPDDLLIPRDQATLITDNGELAKLIERVRAAGSFAYDTEFIGEMTYHPQLCLVQVATATEVALIDPLAAVDLSKFWELLADGSIEKVVHAGEQDIEPVHRNVGKPAANMFDTQVAAGFCAMAYPVALGKLVGELLSIKLTKGHTFTDWQRRPLSSSQLHYAADDVRFLPAMAARLKARLTDLGHVAWAAAECAARCDPTRYAFDPEYDFYHVRGAATLPAAQLAVLRTLMIWRDATAQEAKMPARALLKDEALIDLARQPAKSIERLGRVKFLSRPVIEQHGEELVSRTLAALANPPAHIVAPKPVEPTPSERFRGESLWAAAQAICLSRGIDTAVVTSRQDIGELDRLFADDEPVAQHAIMQGWRAEAMGNQLLELMREKSRVAIRWSNGRLKRDDSR